MMGFVCGCCLIPFFLHDLGATVHSCSQCGRKLGESNTGTWDDVFGNNTAKK
jgi:hypothetical protein